MNCGCGSNSHKSKSRRSKSTRRRTRRVGGGPYTRTSGAFTSFSDLLSALPISSEKKEKKPSRMSGVRKSAKRVHKRRFGTTKKQRREKREQGKINSLVNMFSLTGIRGSK